MRKRKPVDQREARASPEPQDLRTDRMGRFSARSWLSWASMSLSEAEEEEESSSSSWEGRDAEGEEDRREAGTLKGEHARSVLSS